MKRTRCSSAPPQKQRSRTNTRTDAGEIEDNESDYVTIKRSEWELANEGLRLLQQGACFYDNLLMETTNSQRDDLDSLCQIWSSGTPVERILSCLNKPADNLFKRNGDELIANYEPLGVANQVARWTSNSWDARMSNPKFKGRSEPQKQASMDNRDVQIISVLSHLARLRNKNATPPLIVMKAIRMFYKGISHSVTNTDVATRCLLSHEWVEKAMEDERLLNYMAPMDTEMSDEIEMMVKDNLEWWWNIKWARTTKEGLKLLSDLIHTVTGERIPLPKRLFLRCLLGPQDMENWPFLKTYDMQQTVLSSLEMDDIMIQKWQEARIKSKDDTMSYLRRPLPCEDKKVWYTEQGKRTPHFALPIQMYVGTASKEDIQKIIDHCIANSTCKKQIIHGDMQTFKGLIREKLRNAERNNSWVPMAGEWHQVAHMTDAVVIKNWRHIYEPIAHYLNIKGLQLKLVMKEQSIRYRWTMIIANAGFVWLRKMFSEEELSDPKTLMKACSRNIPVWNFLTFIFYFANILWAGKTATQCSDSELMDFVWKYSLLLYADTNKNQYKKGVLQVALVLFDCVPYIKIIMDYYRTYTESGKPCTGAAYDYMNEQVDLITFTPIIPACDYTNIFPLHLQLNLRFRLGVPKVTPTAIEKWSKIINACRQNEKNMQEHVDGVWKNTEVLPDLRYDVESIADYLTLKLGATKEEVTAPSKRNKMSGGDMTLDDCAFSQVMKAKGKLREWITNIVTSGDLFERDAEEDAAEAAAEDTNIDVAIENYEPALEALVGEEEVEVAPVLEDETLDDALLRARAYLQKHKIKRLNRESQEEYIARVAAIMMDGKLARKKRVAAMKNVVPKTKEKTDADYAIAVAAQEEWNRMQGLKPVRPTSILETHQGSTKVTKSELRYYLCLYRDVGYGGQDRTEMHPEHYVRQFPGLLENWQAVSLTCTLK